MNASTHPHPAPRALRALFLAVAVAAVGLGVAALLRPDPIRAEIGSVDRGPVSVWVRDAGRTRIRDRFTVHAPRDGILVRPDWKVGDAVRAGVSVLAVLGPEEPAFVDLRRRAVLEAQRDAALARIDAARAGLGEAEARCLQAWRDLHRAEETARANITPDEEVERLHAAATIAERARDAMRAEVEAARHLARAAELELGDGQPIENGPGTVPDPGRELAVRAPIDGSVLRVFEPSGRPILRGQPLFELGDPEALEVRVPFASHDALRLRVGMHARIGTDLGFERDVPLPLEGEIQTIEPRADTVVSALGVEEQRVDVILRPLGEWPRLGDGYHVEVAVEVERSPADGIRTPSASLFRHAGGWAVHRIAPDGRSSVTTVEVGLVAPDYAEIRTGLSPGDRVVLYPSRWIEDGVRVLDPNGR
ncbi:MAG: hypothetical protein RL562_2193 [Planctomycetota bacterium]